jgi:hypothetical protein
VISFILTWKAFRTPPEEDIEKDNDIDDIKWGNNSNTSISHSFWF